MIISQKDAEKYRIKAFEEAKEIFSEMLENAWSSNSIKTMDEFEFICVYDYFQDYVDKVFKRLKMAHLFMEIANNGVTDDALDYLD